MSHRWSVTKSSAKVKDGIPSSALGDPADAGHIVTLRCTVRLWLCVGFAVFTNRNKSIAASIRWTAKSNGERGLLVLWPCNKQKGGSNICWSGRMPAAAWTGKEFTWWELWIPSTMAFCLSVHVFKGYTATGCSNVFFFLVLIRLLNVKLEKWARTHIHSQSAQCSRCTRQI